MKQSLILILYIITPGFLILGSCVRIASRPPAFLGFKHFNLFKKCSFMLLFALICAESVQSGHAEDNPAAKKWQPIAEWLEAQQYQPHDLSDAQFSKLIIQVNQSINQYTFIKDKGDVWKTPDQFYHDRGGDCEDYSIAKMDRLAKAGIPLQDMQIVIIRQNYIFSHAILAVHRGSQTYYFDNHYTAPYQQIEEGYSIAFEIGVQ